MNLPSSGEAKTATAIAMNRTKIITLAMIKELFSDN